MTEEQNDKVAQHEEVIMWQEKYLDGRFNALDDGQQRLENKLDAYIESTNNKAHGCRVEIFGGIEKTHKELDEYKKEANKYFDLMEVRLIERLEKIDSKREKDKETNDDRWGIIKYASGGMATFLFLLGLGIEVYKIWPK